MPVPVAILEDRLPLMKFIAEKTRSLTAFDIGRIAAISKRSSTDENSSLWLRQRYAINLNIVSSGSFASCSNMIFFTAIHSSKTELASKSAKPSKS
jgi:hypothetical protein